MTYVCNKTRILSTPDSMFSKNKSSYVQGQVTSGSREYFYYVDHQGMVRWLQSGIRTVSENLSKPVKTHIMLYFSVYWCSCSWTIQE